MKSSELVFAIVDQAVYSHFFLELARELKKTTGARLHFYANDASHIERRRAQASDIFETFNKIVKEHPSSVDPDDRKDILTRAARLEQRIGRSIGWFRIIDRTTGLGYAPGGYHHPRTRHAKNATDLSIIEKYVNLFEYWDKEINSKKINVFINGFYFEYFSASSNNCMFRCPMSSRDRNYYYFSQNCFGELPPLKEIYKSTKAEEYTDNLKNAPYGQRKTIEKILRTGLIETINRSFRVIIRNTINTYITKTLKDYSLRSEIAYVFREWWVRRKFTTGKFATVLDLSESDYILYALQVEPEVNLHGYSPEYFYQHQAIMSLSRDLPAGVVLVVKEHIPALGRRPGIFYKQIQLLKNVVFADVKESGLELVRNARAVATINGTVGQEAAVLGKPVITFGRHNLYNILPHVRVIRQEEDLYPALRWALSEEFDAAQAKTNGQRFLRALRSQCFDMKDFGFHNFDGYTTDSIKQAAGKLLESLDVDATVGGARDVATHQKVAKSSPV